VGLGGAALVLAAFLRAFPAVLGLGLVMYTVIGVARRRGLSSWHRRALGGVVAGLAVVVLLTATVPSPAAQWEDWVERVSTHRDARGWNRLGLKVLTRNQASARYDWYEVEPRVPIAAESSGVVQSLEIALLLLTMALLARAAGRSRHPEELVAGAVFFVFALEPAGYYGVVCLMLVALSRRRPALAPALLGGGCS
jgi:hypothetical protein